MTQLDFTLIGGPTAIFTLAGVRFLTDPTFDPPGDFSLAGGGALTKTTGPVAGDFTDGSPDVVLLSHDQHADNLDNAGRELIGQAGVTFSTVEAAGRIPGVSGLAPWETAQVEGTRGRTIHVTGVPARHGPAGCEHITGTVTGFVLHGPDLPTVYVSGDNAAVEAVDDIASRFPEIELAVLFTGAARLGLFDNAPLTLTAAGAVEAARALGSAVIIPVHAEGWRHFSESTEDLERAFSAAGLGHRLVVPEPGTTISLDLMASGTRS